MAKYGIYQEESATISPTGGEGQGQDVVLPVLLHRAGYVEKMGTGIARIRSAMQEAGLPEPIFQFDTLFSVTLIRNVREPPKIGVTDVSVLGQKIRTCIVQNGSITIPLPAEETGASERTVRREIKTRKERGVMYREGSSKSGLWKMR